MTGTVILDLRIADIDTRPHRATMHLEDIPDGARVVLHVPAHVNPYTAAELALHRERLVLDVHGDASAVGAWVAAVRDPRSATVAPW